MQHVLSSDLKNFEIHSLFNTSNGSQSKLTVDLQCFMSVVEVTISARLEYL